MFNNENIFAAPFAFKGENYAPYQGEFTMASIALAAIVANTGVVDANEARHLVLAAHRYAEEHWGHSPATYAAFANGELRQTIADAARSGVSVKVNKGVRKLCEELVNRPRTVVVEGKGLEKAIELGIMPDLGHEDLDDLAQLVYSVGKIAKRNEDTFVYSRGEIRDCSFANSSAKVRAWIARNLDELAKGAEEIHLYKIWENELKTPESSNRFDDSRIPDFGEIERDLLEDSQGCPWQMSFDTSLGDVDRLYRKLIRENTPRTPEEAIDVACFAALRLFNLPGKIHKLLDKLEISLPDHAAVVGYRNPELYRFLLECGAVRKAFSGKEITLFGVYRFLQRYCAEENPTPTLRSALRSLTYVYEQGDLFDEASRRFEENLEHSLRVPKSFYIPGAKALLLGAHLGVTEIDTEAPDRDSFLAPEPLLIPGTPEYDEKFTEIAEELPEPELDLSPEAFLKAKLGAYGSKDILEYLQKARIKAEDPALSPWEAFLPEEGFGGREMPFSPALRGRLSEEAYEDWVCSPGRPNDRLVEAKIAELNLEISAENQRKADLRAYLDGLDGKAIIAELEAFNASLGKPEGADKAFLGF